MSFVSNRNNSFALIAISGEIVYVSLVSLGVFKIPDLKNKLPFGRDPVFRKIAEISFLRVMLGLG